MAQYMYGKKTPKNARALLLDPLLTGVLPLHPEQVDQLAPYAPWSMLGNDRYGDCVAVTWANVRKLMTRGANYPSFEQVIAFYKTQNPGFPQQDDGMDIQTALENLVMNGGPDGVKAVAFAKVDHTDLEAVKAALAIFGYVWTGVSVLQANEDEFGRGMPWDYVPGSPAVGGHSIISGGYEHGGSADIKFITWAQETAFTDNFWTHQVDEAWVVIWPEHFADDRFLQGVNIAQLAADYHALTGKVLVIPPVPTPNPTPNPSPTPTPSDPVDAALLAEAKIYVGKHHSGENKKMATALLNWIRGKGY